jgi:hypothetical protein
LFEEGRFANFALKRTDIIGGFVTMMADFPPKLPRPLLSARKAVDTSPIATPA